MEGQSYCNPLTSAPPLPPLPPPPPRKLMNWLREEEEKNTGSRENSSKADGDIKTILNAPFVTIHGGKKGPGRTVNHTPPQEGRAEMSGAEVRAQLSQVAREGEERMSGGRGGFPEAAPGHF